MDTRDQFSEQIARLHAQQAITETILQISRGLNTARNAHDLLLALAGPAIANGAFRVNLAFIDPDERGEPAWIEVVAAWQRDGALLTPIGARLYLPDFPAARIWIEHPDALIFSTHIATDTRLDERLKALGQAWGIQAAVWITVTQAERWVAQLTLSWRDPHPFSEHEIAIYSAIAPLAGPAVENVRLLATLEQQVTARTAELMQASHEADLARELAEKANQAKSIFLANMSHEFRTPLNAILGFAQILAHTLQTPKEQEYLDALIRSGRHLLTLINEVLDFAKIESGHITLQQAEVDIVSLLNEVHNLFDLKAQEKRIQLTITRAPDVPWMICTDEVKLRQILINLIGNAVKFTETGSVTVRVWTPPTFAGESGAGSLRIIFEIEDTGPGIASDELMTLFTAFTQTRTGRQAKEGTGLGLAISQQFVHLLGGDLRVNSVVGCGTTFSFAVQAGVVTSASRPAALSPRQAVALAPQQPVYRLLVVDDQPDNRRVLMALLQPFGFDLREACDGQEALELWQQWQPHLIWIDLRMPKMDGYAAAQAIRSAEAPKAEGGTPNATHTIIIALSASVFEEEQAAALKSGCDDFLRKPFREHEIVGLLEKHLQVRFIYADAAGQPAALNPYQLPSAARVTAANLTALPDDLRQELRKAIESLDVDMVRCVIDRIRPQHAALAEAIAELVKQYRFDLIEQCFEDIQDPHSGRLDG